MSRLHLMIATPAYGGMVHKDYLDAVLGYQRAGIPFALMTLGNESLITRARNTLLAEFAVRPEFSHLLFLDADVQLPPEGLARLLGDRRDVVAAAVPLKGRDASGRRLFNLGRSLGSSGPLHRVEHVGTAALLLSRAAVDALVADARADGRVYRQGIGARGESLRAELHYDVFRTGVVEEEYLSEDYWVCRRLRQLGFDIHVDPRVVTRHSGTLTL